MKWAVAMVFAGMATALAAQAYRLPDERPVVLPRGAGVDYVEAHCSACHSLDYITTQPRGKGREFWARNVDKMIDTHGAEIPPEEAKAIVAYLGRTFG
jgi:sulfite dehydrogenase (cytochrome) subunit B